MFLYLDMIFRIGDVGSANAAANMERVRQELALLAVSRPRPMIDGQKPPGG
jgi:hypothetical protein